MTEPPRRTSPADTPREGSAQSSTFAVEAVEEAAGSVEAVELVETSRVIEVEPDPPSLNTAAGLPSLSLSDESPSVDTVNGFATNLAGVTRRASGAARRALRADEAARAGAFGRALAVLTSLTIVCVAVFGGPTWLVVCTQAALLNLLLAGAIMAWRVKDPREYTRRRFRYFAASCVVASLLVQLYLGVFSPTALVVTLGISFLATGWDRAWALGASGLAALGYFVMAGAITLGLFDDPGQMTASNFELQVFFTFMAPMVMLFTAWVARQGREIIFSAISEAHESALLAGMREAQLAEVKQDLDAALAAGAGVGGRYSGAKMGGYKLGAILGRGAMGEVYAARHAQRGDMAAVKLLLQASASQPTLVARFAREAKITQELNSAHVVRVMETGNSPDGAPFMVMERLKGHDLSWHLRRRGTFSLADALMLADQVGRGLDAAHKQQIVHRDIKPRNLFLAEPDPEAGKGEEEHWKVLDFGVSKLRDSAGTLTQSGMVGTPSYMAPEQAEGGEIDGRADIFALGAVLYRVLTGRRPFEGESPAQVLYEVVHRQPPRPGQFVSELPTQVELVLAVALAKQARHRFVSGAQLFVALKSAARGELAQGTAARGRRILKAHPWGGTVHAPPAAS